MGADMVEGLVAWGLLRGLGVKDGLAGEKTWPTESCKEARQNTLQHMGRVSRLYMRRMGLSIRWLVCLRNMSMIAARPCLQWVLSTIP